MSYTITLIPGDGIGPEVTEAVVRILKVVSVDIDWEPHVAGRARVRAHRPSAAGRADRLDPAKQGRAERTGDDADRRRLHERERRAAQGARSLREPAAGVESARRASRFHDVDLVIVRENTEDLYAGLEHESCRASSKA